MSWLYSRALVEAYLEGCSSDGGPSAPSRSTDTPRAYCSPDRMKALSRLSRFGMTFGPSTAINGEAVLTSYLAAFPVRMSASSVRAMVSTEKARDYGQRWGESFAKFDPVSCTWRTRQLSLFGGSSEYSETLPRWGFMHDGELWERRPPELRTFGSGSGLWPTPCARDWKDTPGMAFSGVNPDGSHRKRVDQLARAVYSSTAEPGLLTRRWVEWLMGWPDGWTELSASGTDKSLPWLRSHGVF